MFSAISGGDVFSAMSFGGISADVLCRWYNTVRNYCITTRVILIYTRNKHGLHINNVFASFASGLHTVFLLPGLNDLLPNLVGQFNFTRRHQVAKSGVVSVTAINVLVYL